MGFRRELPAHGRETLPMNGIPLGITSSWKLIQAGKIQKLEKSSKR
jgi:hypothetical protein